MFPFSVEIYFANECFFNQNFINRKACHTSFNSLHGIRDAEKNTEHDNQESLHILHSQKRELIQLAVIVCRNSCSVG